MSDVGYITLEYLTYLALASVFAAILFVGTTMVLVSKEIATVFVHKFMHGRRRSLAVDRRAPCTYLETEAQ